MLPFNVVLFSHGTEFLQLLGAAVPLLYVANVITAYELGRRLPAPIRPARRLPALSHDNAEIQAQLAEQLDSLLERTARCRPPRASCALFRARADRGVRARPERHDPRHQSRGREPVRLRRARAGRAAAWITMLLGPTSASRRRSGGTSSSPPRKPATKMPSAPAARRPRARLRVDGDAARRTTRARVSSIIAAGPRHHAQREAERMKKRVHLHPEPRAAHAAHLDPRLAAAPQRRRARRRGEGPVGELAEVAERNGQRLLDLINDILDIEKIESGKLTLVPGAHRARRAGARVDAAEQGLRRPLQGALRVARASCRASACAPTASACCR